VQEDLRDLLEQTKRENEGIASRLQTAAASAARATLVPSEAANLLARAEKEMELRKCHAEARLLPESNVFQSIFCMKCLFVCSKRSS
jgi:hypothetical protein